MKKYYLLIFLVMLFYGCTSSVPLPPDEQQILASGICPSIEDNFFIPDWQAFAAIALATSAAILALLYMINRFFGNEAGEAWVKIELFELITTVFIVIVVIAILNASCAIAVGPLFGAPDVVDLNPFDAAAKTLNEFSEDLAIIATILHTIYIPFDFLTTVTLTQRPLGMGTVLQPTAGLGAVMKPVFINSLQMLAIAFIMVRAQLMILDFSTFAMLKYYLPLGIFLRVFSPTRRIGGTLIGLTIGLVIIYPYLIVLNGLTISSMTPFAIDTYLGDLGSIVSAGALHPFDEFSKSSVSVFEPLRFFVFLKLIFSGALGAIMGLYYSLMLRTAAVAFMIGIFFPAFNTLILVTTIRYLTKSFGEEIDVTSLTRMI